MNLDRLAERILAIYPDIDLIETVKLRDDSDGNGPYISHWGDARPQPSDAELMAVTL